MQIKEEHIIQALGYCVPDMEEIEDQLLDLAQHPKFAKQVAHYMNTFVLTGEVDRRHES